MRSERALFCGAASTHAGWLPTAIQLAIMVDQPSDLQRYTARVREAIQGEQDKLSQLQGFKEQLNSTLELLDTLPRKLHHHISVPFGRHAFFPGTLKHTNEYKVHLGAGYYLHCTAYEARGIIQRRLDRIASLTQTVQQQVDEHQARLRVAGDQTAQGVFPGVGADGDQVMEIRESYEDSEALLATAKPSSSQPIATSGASQSLPSSTRQQATDTQHPSQRSAADQAEFDAFFARLEALEQLEEQRQADTSGGQHTTRQPATSISPSAAVRSPAPLDEDEDDLPDSDDEEDEEGDVDWSAAFAPVSLTTAAPTSTTAATGGGHTAGLSNTSQPAPSSLPSNNTLVAAQSSTGAGTSSSSSASSTAPLRKGFLLSNKPTAASGSKSATSPTSSPSAGVRRTETTAAVRQSGSRAGQEDNAARQAVALEQARREAFTGQVLERIAPSQQTDVAGTVVERVVERAGVEQASPASQQPEQPRMSKFKMMRRGLID